MSHYWEQREKAMNCGVEKQISDHVNADNDAATCPDCHEVLDEMLSNGVSSMFCPYCEVEVEVSCNDE